MIQSEIEEYQTRITNAINKIFNHSGVQEYIRDYNLTFQHNGEEYCIGRGGDIVFYEYDENLCFYVGYQGFDICYSNLESFVIALEEEAVRNMEGRYYEPFAAKENPTF